MALEWDTIVKWILGIVLLLLAATLVYFLVTGKLQLTLGNFLQSAKDIKL